jgi:hypothetical protein
MPAFSGLLHSNGSFQVTCEQVTKKGLLEEPSFSMTFFTRGHGIPSTLIMFPAEEQPPWNRAQGWQRQRARITDCGSWQGHGTAPCETRRDS